MERLLVVKLEALGCEAEVRLNGVALAQVRPAQPMALVPAHEYTLAGTNRLELLVNGPAPGQPAAADASAHVRVLLPRIGNPIHEDSVRTLAQLDWLQAAGATPVTAEDVTLPVNFPRWRWLDAPAIEATPAIHAQVLAFVQAAARDLAAGAPERFVAATRLRTEELAVAYQRTPQAEGQRWRDHLQQLHASDRLHFKPLERAGLLLRPQAGGRLHDCLDPQGAPVLCTEPDAQGQVHGLPLRVAVVEGQVHVLR